MRLIKHIILLNFILTICVFNTIIGQDDPVLIFSGRISNKSGSKLEGVKVVIKKDGSIFKTETTASNGKYQEMHCEFGHIYELTFTKSGYVSKTLILDAKKGFYVDEMEKKTYLETSATLFKKEPEVDYSIVTNKPVGKARIDPSTSKLDWDYTYLNQRKNEIEKFLKQVANKQRQQEDLFRKMVAQGNSEFTNKNYSVAIIKYKEALKIKEDANVQQKIKDAEKNLALQEEEKKKNAEFELLIQKGDNLLSSNKFDEAIAVYEQSKSLKPGDQVPYVKIQEANKRKDDLANAEINKQYQDKMIEAKKSFDKKDWPNAKKIYNEASSIKPMERDPKDRIIQIDGIIAKEQANEQNYNKLIADADQALTAKDFDLAISKYRDALRIKPSEQYPNEQITKAEKLKSEATQQALKDKRYQDLIDKADSYFDKQEYKDAKSSYNEALTVKPEEAYPKNKINDIEAKLKEIEELQQQQAELKRQYDELIIKADGLYYSEKWEEAKAIYVDAKKIKSDELYPQQKIDEINTKLDRIAQDEAARKQRYDDIITAADNSFNNNRWEEAKRDYNNALTIYSEESYPKEKLKEIDVKIAEEKQQKEEEDKKQLEFDQLLSEGDKSFAILEFDKAKEQYENAKSIYPDNIVVTQKLLKVESKLKEMASLQEIQDQYNELIVKADAARDAKSWNESKELYTSAYNLKPSEIYPQKEIEAINLKIEEEKRVNLQKGYDEIIQKADEFLANKDYEQALLTYNQAKDLKPTESYPLEKIREIRRLTAQLEDQNREYNKLIAQADNEYESEKWDLALISYKNALKLYEKEYPKNRVEEINKKLEELRANAENETSKRKQYDDLITKADREFSEDDYEKSKTSFEAALALYNQEYYPKQKLAEIEIKLKNQAASNEKNSKYNDFIVKADAARDAKEWMKAKQFYRDANMVDGSASYPQEQLDWINDQMKKETEDEFKQQYDKLIAAADDQFNTKNYEKSKELFLRAKNMNPEDGYPDQKIAEIDRTLKDLLENKQNEEKLLAITDKYNKLINQADAARDAEQWSKAKNYYKQAFDTKSDESYPQEQIDWINNRMLEVADEELDKQYQKIVEVADKMYADKNYNKALELYRRAKGLKPTDPYPPEQIRKVEEDRMTAASKEKSTLQFNNLIKAGNSAFEQKKYRLALKRFQDALNIQNDATYPKDKIREINGILDRLAAEKANNSNNIDPSKNQIDNYTVLYGEEVTGKYSESEIDNLIFKGRIEQDDEKQRLISEIKDTEFKEKYDVLEDHIKENSDRLYEIDKIKTERTKEQQDADDNRLKTIPQLDHFKDMESNVMDQRIDYGNQVSTENHENTEELIDKIAENDLDRDLPRQENIPKTDYYKDALTSIEDSRIEGGKELSIDNYTAKEKLESDQSLAAIDRDEPRKNNSPKVELYKDDVSYTEEVNVNRLKTITYSNYDSKESLDTRISTLSVESDIPRQENIPEVDYYKDNVSDKDAVLDNNARNNTFSNYDNKEELDTKISELAKDADISREEVVIPEMDRYHDKESDKENLRAESSTDKLYNVYTEKEMLDDERFSERTEMEMMREMNTTEIEAFQDKHSENLGDALSNDIRSNEKVNSEIDDIKEINPTDIVDSYKDQIAIDYPEGVTERQHERANSSGDVVEITIIRYVVRGNKGDEFRKVVSRWGTFYFKNNAVISEYVWDSETN